MDTGTPVFVLDSGYWSKATLIGLALSSDEFSIEHEQDADYGRLEIVTLNDGLWARVREIDEHQIENEKLGDRFGTWEAVTEHFRYQQELRPGLTRAPGFLFLASCQRPASALPFPRFRLDVGHT